MKIKQIEKITETLIQTLDSEQFDIVLHIPYMTSNKDKLKVMSIMVYAKGEMFCTVDIEKIIAIARKNKALAYISILDMGELNIFSLLHFVIH